MGHFNKIVKTMWKALGCNINETSAEKLADTVDLVELIIDGIDCDCDKKVSIGHRAAGNPEIALTQVISDLIKIRAFEYQKGRLGHPSFKDFPSNLLKNLDYHDFHSWKHMKICWKEAGYKLRTG